MKQSELILFFSSFAFNRREVYRILQEEGIDLPRYAVLNRDPDKPDGQSAADTSLFTLPQFQLQHRNRFN